MITIGKNFIDGSVSADVIQYLRADDFRAAFRLIKQANLNTGIPWVMVNDYFGTNNECVAIVAYCPQYAMVFEVQPDIRIARMEAYHWSALAERAGIYKPSVIRYDAGEESAPSLPAVTTLQRQITIED